MKTNVNALLALILTGLFGCDSEEEVTTEDAITAITISPEFYPENFAQSLQDNMDYFLDGVGVSSELKLPYDHVLVEGFNVEPSTYTNISTVACYINLLVEMVVAGDELAIIRLQTVLSDLEEAPNWNGLFYWLYEMSTGVLTVSDSGIASAVDNGIMSFSLAALNGAFYNSENQRLSDLALRAQALLDGQVEGWESLYDSDRGLLRAGWSVTSDSLLGYYVDRKSNESRLASLWAVMVSEGSIPATVFTDMTLVVGEYTQDDSHLTAMLTWDGSYFQALLPSLWLDESNLIPDYQIVNDFTEVHKQFADEHNIPFVSASATVEDGYSAFGVEAVSESYRRFDNEINSGTTGTPHALALYYMIDPDDAVIRLNALKETTPEIETSAGWADAIDSTGQVSSKVIGLDQGMFISSFFAESVRNNVEDYLDRNGYTSLLYSMYTDFIPDETLEE